MSTSSERSAVQGRAAALAAACLLLAGANALGAPKQPAKQDDPAALERSVAENAWLAVRAELASEQAFYLVLDVESRSLELMYGGTLLRETPVQSIEVGRPRVLFAESEPPQWEPRIWSGPTLDPPATWQRTVIVPPPADATGQEEEEVKIPPTPEEAFPAPPRFEIHYEGGLTVEFISGKTALGWGARLGEALRALGFGSRDPMWLRLVLDPAEHAAFYRSLPPETRFTVVPKS